MENINDYIKVGNSIMFYKLNDNTVKIQTCKEGLPIIKEELIKNIIPVTAYKDINIKLEDGMVYSLDIITKLYLNNEIDFNHRTIFEIIN